MSIRSVLLTAVRIAVYGGITLVVDRLLGLGHTAFVASAVTLVGERILANR